jgi:hypothetical protein
MVLVMMDGQQHCWPKYPPSRRKRPDV